MPDEASAMLFKNDAPVPGFVEQGKVADTAAGGSSKRRKPIIVRRWRCCCVFVTGDHNLILGLDKKSSAAELVAAQHTQYRYSKERPIQVQHPPCTAAPY